jgi:hypothetical protein
LPGYYYDNLNFYGELSTSLSSEIAIPLAGYVPGDK